MNHSAAHALRSHAFPRRTFLKQTLIAAGAAAIQPPVASHAGDETQPGLIDVNVHLSRWPTRRLPDDNIQALIARLRRNGVVQAWAGSFDALLHKDIRSVNSRVAQECNRHGNGLLVPIGTVNPTLSDWRGDLAECADEHRMPGIRLYPNYHGYTLDHPEFVRLLDAAADRRMFVQLTVLMEDERMMHPLLRVTPVDIAPLARLVRQTPQLRMVLLNASQAMRGPTIDELFGAGEVYVDIATLESVGGLDKLLVRAPSDRLLFGSHAPFFYMESAVLKLQESELTTEQLQAIGRGNARRLLSFGNDKRASQAEQRG